MFRVLLVLITLSIHVLTASVTIDYPSNKYIEERLRKDFNNINPIFRYYITPREIQFHTDAINDTLPYFLRCQGSTNSINFTIPLSATKYLLLDTDHKTSTITARLLQNQLTSDLVGRYICSETVNDKEQASTVHIFIQNDRSIFTKNISPKVFKQTGVHFFNLPCQTTNWYPRISCPLSSNSRACKLPPCNPQERQANELKCNTPVCSGEDPCIPVYYTPSNLNPQEVFFDPQIGFALENPMISDGIIQFTCKSNYTSSEESRISYDVSEPDYIKIHQSNLVVMKDERVQLSCEIQYTLNIDQKIPRVFWFEDIYNLQLISNTTAPYLYDPKTHLASQNSTIILQGFRPGEVYRFYCIRQSDHGPYSRSVDITCARDLDTNDRIFSGSNSSINNRLWNYTSTTDNMTDEGEMDFKVVAKSSALEKSASIQSKATGHPAGEISFIPGKIPDVIPWRNDHSEIYSYGIHQYELYHIVCNVRHRSDRKKPLNVFIQYDSCAVDNCLSNLLEKTCRPSSNRHSINTTTNRIDNSQTQVVSTVPHTLNNPSIGHRYLCCYEQNGLIEIAKAITVLSYNRSLFTVHKPEDSLAVGDILTYRCEAHELIYDDLHMIYYDGSVTYERSYSDKGWHRTGSGQVPQINIQWKSSIRNDIRSIVIEVKTPPLTKSWNRAYFQCIARSKRSDIIPKANSKYIIDVADPISLQFKTILPKVSRINQKANTNVKLDCAFKGRPKPKIVWLRGKLPLNNSQLIYQFEDNDGSLLINRVQPLETGYYTCLLNNGRGEILQRSFYLRIAGTNPDPRFGGLIAMIIIVAIFLLLVMILVLIIFGFKYCRMIKNVEGGIYKERQAVGIEDENQPALSQLARIPLPDNFASQPQIHTFLSYVNGKHLPAVPEDFKELGRGQFGVVYQVRLPDVGLVAAKILPETIRNTKHKRKKSDDIEENEEMIAKQEIQKKKAAEMLIDEMKVMHKAGKHVNIVTLKKVAYPEAKFKLLFTGGPIAEEDSFYLMELCSNGSLESMLKRFIRPSINTTENQVSLYETLSQRSESEMTIVQAYERCVLTDDDLKLIAYQVACGVDYLNRKQIAHCDVAPRNVLVTSRFIMKICDFGLATWTTYKNYREQLAQNQSVQLEKNNNEIAAHNLTPELARAFLRASNPDERLLNKSTIKSDVWSFGIFLWTLFLKCRIRPFNKLLEEMKRTSDEESFFHRLARMISDNRVLRYIDYQPEIPRNIYGIIRDCLVEENSRPEMTRIRAYLCHSTMLSKQAFQYYRSEYNRYQEENATDGDVERLAEDQGVRDLPSFEGDNSIYDNSLRYDDVTYRPIDNQDVYYPEAEEHVYQVPTKAKPSPTTKESNPPPVHIKKRAPIIPPVPPRKPSKKDDSYM